MLCLGCHQTNDQSVHEPNYITEIFLKMYNKEELLNGTLPLKFTAINHYQWEDPVIKAKLRSTKYKNDFFAEAGILLIW